MVIIIIIAIIIIITINLRFQSTQSSVWEPIYMNQLAGW